MTATAVATHTTPADGGCPCGGWHGVDAAGAAIHCTPAELFFRHGEAFTGTAAVVDGKATTFVRRECGRCGGAGGADKWAATGWTCFQCGGRGNTGTKAVRLFTCEQLGKLNATAAKRAAKKAAAAAVERAAREAEANARRDAFLAEHGALVAKAQAFAERSTFVADVVGKALDRCELTEKQAAALAAAVAKIEAGDALKAASRHVGKVGERLTLTVTCERITVVHTQFGALFITAMRDAAGNAIVGKGRFTPAGARFDRDTDRWVLPTEPFAIKGTVKEHGEFRGELNTVLARIAG